MPESASDEPAVTSKLPLPVCRKKTLAPLAETVPVRFEIVSVGALGGGVSTVAVVETGAEFPTLSVPAGAKAWPPAASAAVTPSVGEDVAPADHANALLSYGPPLGADTVDGVCVQPVAVPPSADVELEAAPDSPSVTTFVSVKLPAAAPR